MAVRGRERLDQNVDSSGEVLLQNVSIFKTRAESTTRVPQKPQNESEQTARRRYRKMSQDYDEDDNIESEHSSFGQEMEGSACSQSDISLCDEASEEGDGGFLNQLDGEEAEKEVDESDEQGEAFQESGSQHAKSSLINDTNGNKCPNRSKMSVEDRVGDHWDLSDFFADEDADNSAFARKACETHQLAAKIQFHPSADGKKPSQAKPCQNMSGSSCQTGQIRFQVDKK